jgi:thiamine-phosphate pyrophosphorylase
MPPPTLVVVTDRHLAASAGHGLTDVVASAAEGGARWVLLREKDLPRPERRRLALDLLAALAPHGGHLIVAGDAGLAADVAATAVHLSATDPWPPTGWAEPGVVGQGARPSSVSRAPAGGPLRAAGSDGPPGWGGMVGRSCHDLGELRSARREGVDYATLSPVFVSPSKPGYGPALGLGGLAAACDAVPDVPVLALGGVGPGRAADCAAARARGVAVMGEVMRAPDPAAVVGDLVAELAVVLPGAPTGGARATGAGSGGPGAGGARAGGAGAA